MEEIRVFAGGTELCLRPLSAGERLEAGERGAALARRHGGGREAQVLALAAEALRGSLYDGERPAFASGEEVLAAFSALELLELAEPLGLFAPMPRMEREESGPPPRRPEASREERTGERPRAAAQEEPPREAPLPRRRSDQPRAEEGREIKGPGAEPYLRLTRRAPDPLREEDAPARLMALREAAETEEDGLESLSQALRRDARRYDGGFVRY